MQVEKTRRSRGVPQRKVDVHANHVGTAMGESLVLGHGTSRRADAVVGVAELFGAHHPPLGEVAADFVELRNGAPSVALH